MYTVSFLGSMLVFQKRSCFPLLKDDVESHGVCVLQGKLPDKHFAFKGMGRVKDQGPGRLPCGGRGSLGA